MKKWGSCFNKIFVSVLLFIVHIPLQAQWIKTSSSPAVNIYSLEKNGNIILAGTQAGIFKSTNFGESWSSTGLVNVPVYSIAVSNTHIFVGTNDGVKFSTDNGLTWQVINYGNNGLSYPEIKALYLTGDYLYAGANGGYKIGGVFVSTNNAVSWNSISTGISDKNIQTITSTGTNLFAGTANDGVYLTTNNGVLWTFAGLTNTSINIIKIVGTNIFAGTPNGVYFSNNNGSSWVLKNSGLTMVIVNSMIASGNNIFIGTPGAGVFLSTNNGTSWLSVNQGLTELNIKAFLILGSDIYLAASSGNIWRRPLSEMVSTLTVKNGIIKQWLTIQNISMPGSGPKTLTLTNLFQGNVGTLSYAAISSNINIATVSVTGSSLTITPVGIGDCTITVTGFDAANGSSIDYSFDVNVGLTGVKEDRIPARFELLQNFPNPFNPTTNIEFSLSKQSYIKLKVYDLLGEEIASLVDDIMPPGIYVIKFNANKLASGIYICKLFSSDFVMSRKMILVK